VYLDAEKIALWFLLRHGGKGRAIAKPDLHGAWRAATECLQPVDRLSGGQSVMRQQHLQCLLLGAGDPSLASDV